MIRRIVVVPLAMVLCFWVSAGCGAGTGAKTAPSVTGPSSTTSSTGSPSSTVTGGPATTATPITGVLATTTTTKGVTSTTRAPAAVPLTENDNGTMVAVAKGGTIQVVLASLYWMFPTAPNPAALRQVGSVVYTPAPIGTCVPGEGCGTVAVTYDAIGSGEATITASRTSCGEALKCTGTSGTYSVVVHVEG